FSAAVLDRLSRLDAKKARELFGSLFKTANAVLEDFGTRKGGHFGHGHGCLDGSGDTPIDGFCIRQSNPSGDFLRVLIGDLQVVVGLLRSVREIVWVLRSKFHGFLVGKRSSLDKRGVSP